MGLFPYVFTASRHLVFTLSLSLPLWLGTIIWSVVFQFNNIIAHLVPLGTPGALMPIIVLIESIRSVIRPFTLAIRLAANMIAGHLLLTLLGGQGQLG
jgi:F-type H+-transporting ATPase subunit a